MKDVNTNRLTDSFVSMAKIASPSLQENKFSEYVRQQLTELGFFVEEDQAGAATGGNTGNLIATLGGDAEREALMLCCHMDTVQPCQNIRPLIDGDTIHTDGSTILSGDDKGGIAAILEAVRQVKAAGVPHGTLQVVLTIAEEIGMFGSKNLDYSKIVAKKAIIIDAEGTPGTIVVQGPAKDVIKATIQGKSAHAGLAPETGVSAIQVAARAIDRMKLLRIDAETTANIGTIKGGEATNIVADRVEIIAEARSLSNEKLDAQSLHMKECFVAAAREFSVSAQVDIQRSYAAFTLTADNPLVRQCVKAMEQLGLQPQLVSTGGGSDCNVFNAKGITAVDLAVGMTNVHTKEESILISDLETVTRLLVEIIRTN
ncbi:MAG TPA: M20/M25/M40 family metallo-hydrolase [Patescibacteria group bacterium]|nr:M20/M25/M40 family metallo-hydrolase [Patescibacteria group bacterium]